MAKRIQERDAIIAHECGHILCRHVLYHSIAQYILKGADNLGLLGKLDVPVQYAILYWYRKANCHATDAVVS